MGLDVLAADQRWLDRLFACYKFVGIRGIVGRGCTDDADGRAAHLRSVARALNVCTSITSETRGTARAFIYQIPIRLQVPSIMHLHLTCALRLHVSGAREYHGVVPGSGSSLPNVHVPAADVASVTNCDSLLPAWWQIRLVQARARHWRHRPRKNPQK